LRHSSTSSDQWCCDHRENPRIVESNGEPDALDGLSDLLRAELLTLTSSDSVRLAHWRARHHDVSAELYAWLNREYA
jgi:hypothetical protein